MRSPAALTFNGLMEEFPSRIYPSLRANQEAAFGLIAANPGVTILELPVGSGKTAIGYTYLRALAAQNRGPFFYIVPNKTHVQGVRTMHPDMQAVFGRNEYQCLHYGPEVQVRADEVPCASLKMCSHRVDPVTGATFLDMPGVEPCPYLSAKFAIRPSSLVVCTMAFYLYRHLFNKNLPLPNGLVIDEAQRLAENVRTALSYDITDWQLQRSIKLLRDMQAGHIANVLDEFLQAMIRTLRRKSSSERSLLQDEELEALAHILRRVDSNEVQQVIQRAIASGIVDSLADRETLKQLEVVAFNLRRYLASLEFAVAGDGRGALTYVTYAYSHSKPESGGKVQHRLIVRSYHVAPLIKRLLPPNTLAYSGTIGNDRIFGFETGIVGAYHSLSGDFPSDNTRLYVPTDTADLSAGKRSRGEPNRTLRQIARQCRKLADKGLRALVVLVSEDERERFLRIANEEGVIPTSYSSTLAPRDAVTLFREGVGDVLVGTAANYGEGLDLPNGIAPVTFFLRPGYPNPTDPGTQFEVRRYGKGQAWALWRWRVLQQALQVRGRNVRSSNDRGVTIFVSQQFRDFVFAGLPAWLQPSYRRGMTLEQCCDDAIALLEGAPANPEP